MIIGAFQIFMDTFHWVLETSLRSNYKFIW